MRGVKLLIAVCGSEDQDIAKYKIIENTISYILWEFLNKRKKIPCVKFKRDMYTFFWEVCCGANEI